MHQVVVTYNNLTLFSGSVNDSKKITIPNCVNLTVDNCANDQLNLTIFNTSQQIQCTNNESVTYAIIPPTGGYITLNTSKYNLNNTTMPAQTAFLTPFKISMDVKNQSLFLYDQFGAPMFGQDLGLTITIDSIAKTLVKNNSIYFKPKPAGSQLYVEYNGLELYNDVITNYNITLKSVMKITITNCDTDTMILT